jgi:hypothetical protein
MAEHHSEGEPSSADRFLDTLLDALIDRQRERRAASQPEAQTVSQPSAAPLAKVPGRSPESSAPPAEASAAASAPASAAVVNSATAAPEAVAAARAPVSSIGMDRLIRRMLIGLAVAVVLINIPIAAHGVSLARILPDPAARVIRDGLVLKGSGDRIYILQDDQLRWISSLEAFEHLGLTWDDVRLVDDAFLDRFETGRPVDVLLKCDGREPIYVLRDGTKHWIRDLDTFVGEGYVWEDVSIVACAYLRSLPDGDPIPSDAGTPPQP